MNMVKEFMENYIFYGRKIGWLGFLEFQNISEFMTPPPIYPISIWRGGGGANVMNFCTF